MIRSSSQVLVIMIAFAGFGGSVAHAKKKLPQTVLKECAAERATAILEIVKDEGEGLQDPSKQIGAVARLAQSACIEEMGGDFGMSKKEQEAIIEEQVRKAVKEIFPEQDIDAIGNAKGAEHLATIFHHLNIKN